MHQVELAMQKALEAEFGVKIITNNTDRFKAKFYKIRRSNPIYEPLSCQASIDNPDNELWLVKVEDGEADC